MITYTTDHQGVDAAQLTGFFAGWPSPPSAPTLLRVLDGSTHRVLARDGDRVVGFVTAVSDGVLAAYLPLLEVLSEYQGRGIGTALVRRLLGELGDVYMVDLLCDEELVAFYERMGLQRAVGMARRNYSVLAVNGESP